MKFTIPEYPDYPPRYPLTVFIATKNLTTSQAGWNAVDGGYSYTYNTAPAGEQTVLFKSVQPDSREQVVISAPGFSKATIAVDNYLAANIGVSGELRAVYNGHTHSRVVPQHLPTLVLSIISQPTGVVCITSP